MQKSRRGTSDDGTTVTAAHLWNLLISYEIRANHIYLPFDLRDKRNRSAINTEWNKILRLFTLSVNIYETKEKIIYAMSKEIKASIFPPRNKNKGWSDEKRHGWTKR